MQIVLPRSNSSVVNHCNNMNHTESNTQLADATGRCYHNFKCEKVVDMHQSRDTNVSSPSLGAKELEHNHHFATSTSTDMANSPSRVRWSDTDSPSCNIVADENEPQETVEYVKFKRSALKRSSYIQSSNTNESLHSSNTNVEVNKIDFGCSKTKKMTKNALQQQMKRIEEKIHQAAKLELYHMNKSKELREKRSRMMSLYEKMNIKLMKSSNTENNNTLGKQPTQPTKMDLNDIDQNQDYCHSSQDNAHNTAQSNNSNQIVTTYHKFPPLYNPKAASSS